MALDDTESFHVRQDGDDDTESLLCLQNGHEYEESISPSDGFPSETSPTIFTPDSSSNSLYQFQDMAGAGRRTPQILSEWEESETFLNENEQSLRRVMEQYPLLMQERLDSVKPRRQFHMTACLLVLNLFGFLIQLIFICSFRALSDVDFCSRYTDAVPLVASVRLAYFIVPICVTVNRALTSIFDHYRGLPYWAFSGSNTLAKLIMELNIDIFLSLTTFTCYELIISFVRHREWTGHAISILERSKSRNGSSGTRDV